MSRHSRAVLAFCCFLCNLKHLLLGLLHVLLPLTLWTRAIYSDCGSIDTIHLVMACTHHDVHSSLNSGKCFNAAISHAMRVLGTVLLPPTRQFRSRHTSDVADVSSSSNDKTSFPRPQHEGRLPSSCVVTASSQALRRTVDTGVASPLALRRFNW